MITEEGTVITKAVFSPDRTHRYLLEKSWDGAKPKAMIIMSNPSLAGVFNMDYTTLYILNNLSKLNYGAVSILNMDSRVTTKIKPKDGVSTTTENLAQIIESANEADAIILAIGKIAENNKAVHELQDNLI
jgi:hypothetical protein